jgi:hypothetical protein
LKEVAHFFSNLVEAPILVHGEINRERFWHNQPMCGRYRLSRRKQIIEQYFDSPADELDWAPRYNIAPTQPVPVVRQKPSEPARVVNLMRWGLIPNWAKSLSGPLLINARSETAAATPSFGDPLRFRRCLIPADGFYEWQRKGTAKQPFCFEVNDGEMFALRRNLGWLERTERAVDQIVFHPDDDTERSNLCCSQPNARHSRTGQLRRVARSGYDRH